MAVLVEALSVVVKRKVIEQKLKNGWSSLLELIPNATLCFDDELARVGFMSPAEVSEFVETLTELGMQIFKNGHFEDAAVVDQVNGPTLPTSWLEFGKLPCDDEGNKVSACWLFEGERKGAGLHFISREISLALPRGWKYEKSLSKDFTFVRND